MIPFLRRMFGLPPLPVTPLVTHVTAVATKSNTALRESTKARSELAQEYKIAEQERRDDA